MLNYSSQGTDAPKGVGFGNVLKDTGSNSITPIYSVSPKRLRRRKRSAFI